MGHASWGTEAFEFKIGEWCDGIGLMMRHTGYGSPRESGAGIWPDIDKAKQVAEETVKRLLNPGCSITWTEVRS
jgi:hypothetical protein